MILVHTPYETKGLGRECGSTVEHLLSIRVAMSSTPNQGWDTQKAVFSVWDFSVNYKEFIISKVGGHTYNRST